MPAKWKYGFLCDGAMQVFGKWTFQGVFDRIQAVQFPAIHPALFLVFKFNGPVGPHTLKIHLEDSKGKRILPEIRVPMECREFTDSDAIFKVGPIPILGPGFFLFKAYLDEEKEPMGTVELQVHQINLGPTVGKEPADDR